MNILTFDTALNKTYVSLKCENSAEKNLTIENRDDKYHSAFLIQEIANLLKTNGLLMRDINAIGVNVGPGSFTGIRACTTIGRVIAQQTQIPLVPVSSLEILSKIAGNKKTLTTLDARKNSAFVGIYENGKEITAPKIVTVDEMLEMAKTVETVVCDAKMENLLDENGINAICYEDDNYPLNSYLMELTAEKLKSDEDYNWAKVKPLYIQPPSVFGK